MTCNSCYRSRKWHQPRFHLGTKVMMVSSPSVPFRMSEVTTSKPGIHHCPSVTPPRSCSALIPQNYNQMHSANVFATSTHIDTVNPLMRPLSVSRSEKKNEWRTDIEAAAKSCPPCDGQERSYSNHQAITIRVHQTQIQRSRKHTPHHVANVRSSKTHR